MVMVVLPLDHELTYPSKLSPTHPLTHPCSHSRFHLCIRPRTHASTFAPTQPDAPCLHPRLFCRQFSPSFHSSSLAFALRYDGPLEYLTMWMCLFLSSAACDKLLELQGHNPNWGALKGIRARMSCVQSIHPHPLDVILKLLARHCSCIVCLG